MLQDDFVALIQKEFGKPLEKESEIGYQEGQLHPIIHGLLRCGEFKFLQVLKHEIVEAVKNTIRQVSLFAKHGILGFDSRVNLYSTLPDIGIQSLHLKKVKKSIRKS